MDLSRMLRSLRAEVQGAFPFLHGHQVKAMSEATLSMIAAGHCQLSRMAVIELGRATVPSCERRWQRLVANERLDSEAMITSWARAVLSDVAQVTLILDETPKRNDLRAMKLCRQIHGRAIPVVWSCYKPDALPMTQDRLVVHLLEQADRALPEGAEPTLLADRGLSWPQVLDFCTEHNWHYVLRAQAQTRVKLDDGRELRFGDLAPRPGAQWCGPAWVFKKAGWRRSNLVAYWQPDTGEPWLLITDLAANRHRCRQYCKRMRIEQSFRDEKSSGFQWNQSRVRDPEHATRLLLIMALAMRHLIYLGLSLIRAGKRWLLERRDRRTLSVFQLGLRYVQRSRRQARSPPRKISVGN